jgi:hypothetical protein
MVHLASHAETRETSLRISVPVDNRVVVMVRVFAVAIAAVSCWRLQEIHTKLEMGVQCVCLAGRTATSASFSSWATISNNNVLSAMKDTSFQLRLDNA